ncbi:helix-turn-helix domain-containing protein [Defluviimonas sp. WL0075]|uniref:Helix-turn-helix domain-containing protein n=1 Tax=Albidovulum sediminicola TaxID=2984331 RepID=A0ABT2Z230_9RHOB|nr:helix-turn-helix domain-containing protein [Defluviimonas sp. WL0075]MCV2865145.1 helix-turn-helix domain-containing protein [Defluviimonas sp. WL0075]
MKIDDIPRSGKITFAPDYSSAVLAQGEVVSFTRSEARALEILTQNGNRLLTRARLLDAVAGEGSESNDRAIDFLINRLRRKLCDDARDPKYIATRYGEGYVWIAPADAPAVDLVDADFIIGPLRGLDQIGQFRGLAEQFANALYRAVKSDLLPEQVAVFAPDCPATSNLSGRVTSRSLELTFFLEAQTINCVATSREFRTGRVLAVRRVTLDSETVCDPNMAAASALATFLARESWHALAIRPEAEGPLALAMYNATSFRDVDPGQATDSNHKLQRSVSIQEARNIAYWKQTKGHLKALRAANPDDPTLKLLYATHLHTKYVLTSYQLFTDGVDERAEDEDAIEALVLEALPAIYDQPEYLITAAKLLHFLGRGYSSLAREIAEDAYRRCMSVAGSLTVIGQLRAFGGEFDSAVACFDQALNLVKPGSAAHRYKLAIKCQALVAAGDYDRLKSTKQELYALSPLIALFFEPVLADPENLSFRAKAATLALTRARARGLLMYTYYLSARQFSNPVHRDRLMHSLLKLLIRRFGAGIVPDEVARACPDLMALLVQR